MQLKPRRTSLERDTASATLCQAPENTPRVVPEG